MLFSSGFEAAELQKPVRHPAQPPAGPAEPHEEEPAEHHRVHAPRARLRLVTLILTLTEPMCHSTAPVHQI